VVDFVQTKPQGGNLNRETFVSRLCNASRVAKSAEKEKPSVSEVRVPARILEALTGTRMPNRLQKTNRPTELTANAKKFADEFSQ